MPTTIKGDLLNTAVCADWTHLLNLHTRKKIIAKQCPRNTCPEIFGVVYGIHGMSHKKNEIFHGETHVLKFLGLYMGFMECLTKKMKYSICLGMCDLLRTPDAKELNSISIPPD